MAQQFFKIDIRDSKFPLLAEQQTRTIIEIVSAEAPTKEDLVGVQYCHNVMPTIEGLESVGFIEAVVPSPDLPGGEEFDDTRTIYADDTSVGNDRRGERLTIVWDTAGNVYVLIDFIASWLKLASSPAVGPNFSTNDITIGTVDAISYIFYSEDTAFVFNFDTLLLEERPLIGLTLNEVLGVVGSNGYLVAYSKTDIAWSSTLDPTDFTPSTVTGAGGGKIAGTQGNVLFGVSNTLGILLYTFANVISAYYTGNVQFPFKFRPVKDAKGGVNLDRIAYEPDTDGIYTYSKAGLQEVKITGAVTILPEVTDFLAGGRFDVYDTDLQEYVTTVIPDATTVRKKVKYIASRYLIISYNLGEGLFRFALIYDLALNRLGKIKIDHVDVFDYVGGSNQDEVSKQSIAFLLPSGEVSLLDFAVDSISDGVLILAKLQATRTRLFTLLGVETENVLEDSTFSVGSLVSLDGKNGTYVPGKPSLTAKNLREDAFKVTGKNHSIVYEGQFNVTTALIRYTINGRR